THSEIHHIIGKGSITLLVRTTDGGTFPIGYTLRTVAYNGNRHGQKPVGFLTHQVHARLHGNGIAWATKAIAAAYGIVHGYTIHPSSCHKAPLIHHIGNTHPSHVLIGYAANGFVPKSG